MPRAMVATFHPCDFGFVTTNIRRVGNVVSGGRSLSGFEDRVETDGGGYLQADFSTGSARTREQNLAIRAAIEAMDGGTTAVDVLLCAERHFQPVLPRVAPPGSPFNQVLPDDAPDKGARYTARAAALRSTSLIIDGNSELPVEPGNLFSIQHPAWGWRAYRIVGASGQTITFRSPLREAVTTGTPMEFDTPRCRMRLAQNVDFPTEQGLRTAISLSFVEDMRPPT